jgi:hypothetical protein
MRLLGQEPYASSIETCDIRQGGGPMTYEPEIWDVSECARAPMHYPSAANNKEQA